MTKKITFMLALFVMVFAMAQTKKVDIKKSTLIWKGYKVIGGHSGTVGLKSGKIIFKDDKLTGGTFVVDMNSISTTDLEGDSKTRLDNHLKNEDFFNTKKYPKATLTIKKSELKSGTTYNITANLTIKGKTHSVSFEMTADKNSATATVSIDRSKYGIVYNSDSSLGDKMIKNNFDIDIKLSY